MFLKRIHPYLQIPLEEGETYNPWVVFKDFMLMEDLYQGIPDVMHCVVTTFFIGHNESYVESIGSKLKHQNPPNRNLDLDHNEEELFIA